MNAPEDLGLTVKAGGPTAAPETPGLWVRTTVHLALAGPRGSVHYVDPADPDVAHALRATWLVPLAGQNYQPEETP